MNKYLKECKHEKVDIYRVCDIFNVNDPSGAVQHAIKKLLMAGQRGAKDYVQDLEEAKHAIERKLSMLKEDREAGVSSPLQNGKIPLPFGYKQNEPD